ncbi:MAG: hypothetical protein ACOY5F_02125 [Pseudomonadota bacterium]
MLYWVEFKPLSTADTVEAFKRNQIEEAIALLSGEDGRKHGAALRTRIKRLLDTDRNLGRKPRSKDAEENRYAFYSEEAPGKGVEIWFTPYEAFAVHLGLRLLAHGWPQTFVVSVLRRERTALEDQHHRILAQDAATLFDEKALLQNAQAGALAFDNIDPVFLVVVSPTMSIHDDLRQLSTAVCRGVEQIARFQKQTKAISTSFFELVGPAHALHRALSRSKPRKRGRGA